MPVFDRVCTLLGIILLLCSTPLLASASSQSSSPTPMETVAWRKTPMTVELVVGQERLLHFPQSVSVGLPPALTERLRVLSIDGTLYLQASTSFERTRVLVRAETEGPVYVLDVVATAAAAERAPLPDLQVQPDVPVSDVPANVERESAGAATPGWGYVALTRHAAQQLYAPDRLLTTPRGVVAMPVDPEPIALVRGGTVVATPVASWKAGALYVTAVQLTNRRAAAIVLDPRELQGAWLAATFQHNRLLPAGSDADTTVVYLVSDRPFAPALAGG